jgi:hypothetical protein
MQILFIFIGIIGLLFIVFAIRIFIKIKSKKEIAIFELNNNPKVIEFNTKGLHSICFIGVGFISDKGFFNVELKNKKQIQLIKTFPRYSFWHSGKIGIEIWKFKIDETGLYELVFKNVSDLVAKKPMLMSKRFFQSKIKPESIRVLIKETIPVKYRILSIVFLVIGINAFAWGIIIGINPNVFQ